MKLSKRRQFFIVLAAFLVLGIPFKVMVLVEGFTEVRPVNAIPPLAGLICGPVGALACGLGNLIADWFGTFNSTSILGFFGNFIAAYLPFRMWHIYSDEQPNLHKNINILKYVLICFTTALTVSWLLGFGLNYFFGTWIEQIYTFVFFNNFGFSVGLGMPVFIMLDSDDVQISCVEKPKHYLFLKNGRMRKSIPAIYTVIMTVILLCILGFHVSPAGNIPLAVLSALGLCGLLAMLI
jgi:energy-coupling factor transport system substrate-specific component